MTLSRARRAELDTKLAQAESELAAALRTRDLIANMLTEDPEPLPEWHAERLTVELHTAATRVDLWRGVVEKTRAELGAR